MTDYLGREGKTASSDNRANIERAVKLFEDLCPQVRTLAVPDIPLSIWDELHKFAQLIPQLRGRATPDKSGGVHPADAGQGRRLSPAGDPRHWSGAVFGRGDHSHHQLSRLYRQRLAPAPLFAWRPRLFG